MIKLGEIAARVIAGKSGGLVKDLAEAADIFIDTKAEKSEREIKLQEIVNKYNIDLLEASNDIYKAYLEDVANSRDNNAKIQESEHASWMAKNIAYTLDITFTVAFIAMLFVIIYKQVPETNKELFYTSFGLLGGYVSQILSFHRGSSKGSEDKSKELKNLKRTNG